MFMMHKRTAPDIWETDILQAKLKKSIAHCQGKSPESNIQCQHRPIFLIDSPKGMHNNWWR